MVKFLEVLKCVLQLMCPPLGPGSVERTSPNHWGAGANVNTHRHSHKQEKGVCTDNIGACQVLLARSSGGWSTAAYEMLINLWQSRQSHLVWSQIHIPLLPQHPLLQLSCCFVFFFFWKPHNSEANISNSKESSSKDNFSNASAAMDFYFPWTFITLFMNFSWHVTFFFLQHITDILVFVISSQVDNE